MIITTSVASGTIFYSLARGGMNRRAIYYLAALAVSITALFARLPAANAQLRIVTYNTLDNPTTAGDNTLFQTIFQAIGNQSANGIAKRVDILAVQEQTVTGGTNTANQMAQQLNALYGVTSYTSATAGFTNFDRVGVVYDSSTVQFVSAASVDLGGPRPVHRTEFQPVGYDSPEATLYLYSAHFKAGTDAADYAERNVESANFTANANVLGPGANFVLAGDLNLYDESDQAYLNLTGPSALGNDPLALAVWPQSGANSRYLTQSTRTAALPDGGSTGGVDDRFDHQVISDSLLDGEGLTYLGPTSTGLGSLAHSYQSFGNDGTSFNQAINANLVGRSQPDTVLNALHDFSDHLPVIADYQLPAKMMAALGSVPLNVTQNSTVDIDVLIENIANVVAAVGADELDYSISVSGALLPLDLGGTAFPLAGGQTKNVRLNTSTLGFQTGTVTVTPLSQGAAGGVFNLPVEFTVGPGGGGPTFGVIARDDFDSPLNLNNFVQSPLPNTFVSPADGFQKYQVGVSSSIPFKLVDDSTNGFPNDDSGVINSATKSDAWFGIVDLTNPENPGGNGNATWQFDIAGATGLEVSIDMAAMGTFEASDVFNWTYQIDDGAMLPLFTSSVNTGVSASYTMADGDVFNLLNPLRMTDAESEVVQLNNVLQTLTASLTGSGSTLTLLLSATQEGGEEVYAFDNIVVSGFTQPEFLEGDFNEDTFVNAEDLAQWEDDYGLNGDSDADDDGDSDGFDFLIWQRQYGQSSELVATAHLVPEPTSLLLALLSLSLFRRRQR